VCSHRQQQQHGVSKMTVLVKGLWCIASSWLSCTAAVSPKLPFRQQANSLAVAW
jgi:hypothetical protein